MMFFRREHPHAAGAGPDQDSCDRRILHRVVPRWSPAGPMRPWHGPFYDEFRAVIVLGLVLVSVMCVGFLSRRLLVIFLMPLVIPIALGGLALVAGGGLNAAVALVCPYILVRAIVV